MLCVTLDCRLWRRENATNRDDGVRVGHAETIEECRMACKDNASCTAIDWNEAANAGEKCWIHGHWSGGKNVGNRPDIIHEEIDRECDRGITLLFYETINQSINQSINPVFIDI